MPIQLSCDCGRSMRIKEELAGRKIRCPGCGTVLAVPHASPAKNAEEEASYLLLSEPPQEPAAPPRSIPSGQIASDEKERRPGLAPQLPRSLPPETKSAPPTKPRKSSRESRAERSGSGIAINPQIITGVLMMAGAALWFFVGLAAGIIYFYPPVLFVLGIGAVIRGFTGND